MKKLIKKWLLRFTLSGLFLLFLLVTFVLYPSLLYANKTSIGNCNIYHNTPIDSMLIIRLNEAGEIVKSSELFDANLKFDICLNDGSRYPSLIKMILDEPIGTTFYNKIVFFGKINVKENYGLEDKNKWNLTQLIAHSQIHCLQFNKLGVWKSNPIANYPTWKWEGFAEYSSRKETISNNLITNIYKLLIIENSTNHSWVEFSDNTGSSLMFYKRRVLVQFCTDIKRMNFEQLLKDTTTEGVVEEQMMSWYSSEIIRNDKK
jgi:hypothetical protein